MKRRAAVLVALGLALRLAAPAMAVTDPTALMRRIAAAPFRYGGSLQGTVPGVPVSVDRPPVHISIGLGSPDTQGRVRGEAILFDRRRQLIASGPVLGHLASGPGGACSLLLSLPADRVMLSGVCTPTVLSGEIVIQPHPAGDLLARLASWWGNDAVAGRFWLTQASFDQEPQAKRPGSP